MAKANKDSKWTIYVGIFTAALAIGGAIVEFAGWVDERYLEESEFKVITSKIVVATYDQQIAGVKRRLGFVLEYHPKSKDAILYLRKRVRVLKEQRNAFLKDGNYRVGDNIIINDNSIKGK